MKNNLSWVKHEVSSISHWKFKALRREYAKQFHVDGYAGEGRFWALNCYIAGANDCKYPYYDEERRNQLAEDLGFSVDELDCFIAILIQKAKLVYMAEDGCLMTRRTQEGLAAANEERNKNAKYKRDERLRKTAVSSMTNNNVNPDIKMSTLTPEESPPDIEQTKTKTKTKTKTNPPFPLKNGTDGVVGNGEISSSNGSPPEQQKEKVAQKRKRTDPIEHWDKIREVFDGVYMLVKKKTYNWRKDNKENACLWEIIFALRQEAVRQGVEWIEENAAGVANQFFSNASRIDWLRKNFSLINIHHKLNEVLAMDETYEAGAVVLYNDPLYDTCLKIYLDWYIGKCQVEPLVKEKDEEGLALIIAYLRKMAGTDEMVVQAWRTILINGWSKLETFLQEKMDLRDIYINLNKIIQQIKNGKNANGFSNGKNGFHARREAEYSSTFSEAYQRATEMLGTRGE